MVKEHDSMCERVQRHYGMVPSISEDANHHLPTATHTTSPPTTMLGGLSSTTTTTIIITSNCGHGSKECPTNFETTTTNGCRDSEDVIVQSILPQPAATLNEACLMADIDPLRKEDWNASSSSSSSSSRQRMMNMNLKDPYFKDDDTVDDDHHDHHDHRNKDGHVGTETNTIFVHRPTQTIRQSSIPSTTTTTIPATVAPTLELGNHPSNNPDAMICITSSVPTLQQQLQQPQQEQQQQTGQLNQDQQEREDSKDCITAHDNPCQDAAKGTTNDQNDNDDYDDVGDTDQKECPICMEEFQVGDVVSWSSNVKCGHVFHHSCIREWLLRRIGCPYCRQIFLPVDRQRGTLTRKQLQIMAQELSHRATTTYYCKQDGLITLRNWNKKDGKRNNKKGNTNKKDHNNKSNLASEQSSSSSSLSCTGTSLPNRFLRKLVRSPNAPSTTVRQRRRRLQQQQEQPPQQSQQACRSAGDEEEQDEAPGIVVGDEEQAGEVIVNITDDPLLEVPTPDAIRNLQSNDTFMEDDSSDEEELDTKRKSDPSKKDEGEVHLKNSADSSYIAAMKQLYGGTMSQDNGDGTVTLSFGGADEDSAGAPSTPPLLELPSMDDVVLLWEA